MIIMELDVTNSIWISNRLTMGRPLDWLKYRINQIFIFFYYILTFKSLHTVSKIRWTVSYARIHSVWSLSSPTPPCISIASPLSPCRRNAGSSSRSALYIVRTAAIRTPSSAAGPLESIGSKLPRFAGLWIETLALDSSNVPDVKRKEKEEERIYAVPYRYNIKNRGKWRNIRFATKSKMRWKHFSFLFNSCGTGNFNCVIGIK